MWTSIARQLLMIVYIWECLGDLKVMLLRVDNERNWRKIIIIHLSMFSKKKTTWKELWFKAFDMSTMLGIE